MSVPPLLACAAAAALYALGGTGRAGAGPRGRRAREACFYLGVTVTFVVLEPPFDNWADTSFAMHMVQHVVLLTIAPPLLVLGRPWPRMWMPFPPEARRAVVVGLARGRWSAPLRLAARWATKPPVAVGLLATALGVWHVPVLYGVAVRHEPVHILEHTCFVGVALLFWGPLLDAPPVRSRLDHLRRAGWFAAAALPGFILAIVLAYASHPLYPVYADLAHRAFGLSPSGDQQIGAGVMWVPGSSAYFIAFIVSVYRWLEPGADSAAPAREPRPEELSWT
ncbi:MAG TPA: cytochrome c oxidase assembly protein [Gaiellaceae bacterium]|nr:cytochrome c oxidase assembly protein [Gaiellaceae bacterium]